MNKVVESKKKNVLGRGLSALMTPTSVAPIRENKQIREIELKLESENNTVPAEEYRGKTLTYLKLSNVVPNPNQPRKDFDAEELTKLSESIKNSGLLQPILVRKFGSDYQIVAGERRWKAANMAGLEMIPVMVTELSEKETLEVGLIENLQRADLNPIEEAEGIQKLLAEYSISQEEVGKILGRDRSSISNSLRLLKLPIEVKKLVRDKMLSAGSARAIITVTPEEKQIELAHQIITDGLSAREIEEIVKGLSSLKGGKEKAKSRDNKLSPKRYSELEDSLRQALGTKVKLKVKANGSGELAIVFHSGEELERIVERVG